jgi:hypothetical protein
VILAGGAPLLDIHLDGESRLDNTTPLLQR